MTQKNKIITFVIVMIVVIASGLFAISKNSGEEEQTPKMATQTDEGDVAGTSTQEQSDPTYVEQLAKYMTEKGMVLYGAYWCPHCNKQKELFGDAAKYLDYVECDPKGENANPDECQAQGIEAYPTWVFQGKKYPGEQSFAKLAQIVGFPGATSTQP